MKKTILITSGIFILLIILLVWLYLMIYGTPKDGGEIFANLGFTPNSQNTTLSDPFIPDESLPIEDLVDTSSAQQLRQLTTRPVAGFTSITTGSSSAVRYVEQGTGYIYDIDLNTGVETQVSRTTVARVREATFSPSGSTVVLTSYNNNTSAAIVGEVLDTESLSITELQPGAQNIKLFNDTELRYTVVSNGLTTGYAHNLSSRSREELFRFNYANLDTHWRGLKETPIIATKPADDLPGYMYKITDKAVTPIIQSAYGLHGFLNEKWLFTRTVFEGNYQFVVHNLMDNTSKNLPIATLKEKCVFDNISINFLWCAAPISLTQGSINQWYMGTTQFSDYLWLLDIEAATAELIANPERLSGRSIDVKNLQLSNDGSNLFFTHKNDSTLWQFELIMD